MSGRPIEWGDIEFLFTDTAIGDVRTYFNEGTDGTTFTGRRFERFGGGGDRPEVRDRFTAEDLVAVSLLSVDIPPRAALEILERRSATLDSLLADVPADLDLWEAEPGQLGEGSAALELWQQIRAIEGCGWVTANKLMARKRPRLIPVYDRVVRDTLGRGGRGDFWLSLRALLAGETGVPVRERLEVIRRRSGVGDDISLLRIFDVAVWRHGKRRGHRATRSSV